MPDSGLLYFKAGDYDRARERLRRIVGKRRSGTCVLRPRSLRSRRLDLGLHDQ